MDATAALSELVRAKARLARIRTRIRSCSCEWYTPGLPYEQDHRAPCWCEHEAMGYRTTVKLHDDEVCPGCRKRVAYCRARVAAQKRMRRAWAAAKAALVQSAPGSRP